MAYTRTNTEGLTAPAGFHYMPDGTLMSDAEHEELYGQEVSITRYITNFTIDKEDLTASAIDRSFVIEGEIGAEFILQIFDASDPVKFYDFESQAFVVGNTLSNNLKVKMTSNTYVKNIKFPASSGNTYNILLLTPPDKETELSFGSGKYSHSAVITQVATVTNALTFTPATVKTDSYQTFSSTGAANVTSTGSAAGGSAVEKTISWKFLNTETEADGFGLRLIRQPISKDWYFKTTEVIVENPEGDGANSNQILVADLTDIVVGMELKYHKGTSVGTGYISEIDTNPTLSSSGAEVYKITFSLENAFENGETITLHARGHQIRDAIGADIDFFDFDLNKETRTGPDPFTKTVRATGTTATIALTDTYGLHGGGHIKFSGLNVNNDGSNLIQDVAIDVLGAGSLDNDGTITAQLNQTADLAVGTTLTFLSAADFGFGTQITTNNKITINSHPKTARIIYLDLDRFITVGTAS